MLEWIGLINKFNLICIYSVICVIQCSVVLQPFHCTNTIFRNESEVFDCCFCWQGAAVDISHFGSSSQCVLVYATMLGCIIGWDLRAPGIAWKLENDLRKGKNDNQNDWSYTIRQLKMLSTYFALLFYYISLAHSKSAIFRLNCFLYADITGSM